MICVNLIGCGGRSLLRNWCHFGLLACINIVLGDVGADQLVYLVSHLLPYQRCICATCLLLIGLKNIVNIEQPFLIFKLNLGGLRYFLFICEMLESKRTLLILEAQIPVVDELNWTLTTSLSSILVNLTNIVIVIFFFDD